MTKLYRRIITSIATSSVLLANALPVFAATELVITGNGSDSSSTIGVSQGGTTVVTQSNETRVTNNVNVDTNTGDNDAQDNTSGDVSIETGDTSAKVAIQNAVNSNSAVVEPCDCADDTSVLVEGNGTNSDNAVALERADTTVVTQMNNSRVDNNVDVDTETGDNDAEDNTGGDVSIKTGDADVEIGASTVANTNYASIKPADAEGGSLSVIIRENGSDTANTVALALGRTNVLTQWNTTRITNAFDVEADTGDNDAEDNTGGEASIETGDITMKAYVDNLAGFNAADVEDCCYDDVLAKIAGNGTDAESTIAATLGGDSVLTQGNECGSGGVCFNNDIELDGETGDNDNEDNTGNTDGDPMIDTGDVDLLVEVGNQGGSNSFGLDSDPFEWDLPSMGFGFSFSFDFSDLLDWIMDQM